MSNGNGFDPCVTNDPRKIAARDLRIAEAHLACRRDLEPDENQANGDEDFYTDPNVYDPGPRTFVANYTKGMKHNQLGEVDPRSQYEQLLTAVDTGDPEEYGDIPRAPEADRPYVNPQAAIAFDLEGPDAPQAAIFSYQPPNPLEPIPFPAAPTMRSPEAASEMGELYWMSLARDEPFAALRQGGTASQVFQDAVQNMNMFTDFRGPKENGQVTIQTLFRDDFPGVLEGPYLSQFLLVGTALDAARGFADPFGPGGNIKSQTAQGLSVSEEDGYVAYGRQVINQRVFEIEDFRSFMSDYTSWLEIQNGVDPENLTHPATEQFTGKQVFINNGRQLGNYVQVDRPYQASYVAALILLAREVPFGPGNPYDIAANANQTGFITFGAAHLETILAEVANRALKAIWFQKWNVHRRLRPEKMGGRIHNVITGAVSNSVYKLSDEIVDYQDESFPAAELMPRVFALNELINDRYQLGIGTYLLNQIFPEGSPLHPAYGAGHAVIVAACVTILKAFFDTTTAWGLMYEPSADGQSLDARPEFSSSVLAELHKLVSNVSQGRNWAGVHYRSDNLWAIRMGEYVAVGILQEMARTYNEADAYFRVTLFGGFDVIIDRDGVKLA